MYNRTTNLERKGVFKINDAKKETVEAWYNGIFVYVLVIREILWEILQTDLVKYTQSIPELRLVYISTVVTPRLHLHAALN